MIRSLLIGALCGARSMTPLATVSLAALTRALPRDNPAARLLARPLVAMGAVTLAAGELAGDKLRSAPDRTVAPGLLARIASGALTGMALSLRGGRLSGAALGAAAAVAASYPTLAARRRAMRQHGQTRSGLVEDAAILAGSILVVMSACRPTKR